MRCERWFFCSSNSFVSPLGSLTRSLLSASDVSLASRHSSLHHSTMDIDDTLSSSQDSFVILDADHPGQAFDLSALDSLVHFFPSIKGGPAAFPWSYERVQQVKEQRQQRGTLFFDELLALLDVDGQ